MWFFPLLRMWLCAVNNTLPWIRTQAAARRKGAHQVVLNVLALLGLRQVGFFRKWSP